MSAGKSASSHPEAEAAAELALHEGGNSIDAILSGFLTAAALDPATLFAPIAVIVAGVGRGARCIDGRPLQPGSGARRPRGLAPGQATPEAAFAAVPRTLGTLAIAHTYGANKSMAALVRSAVTGARKKGSEARAELLDSFARRGPRILQQMDVARVLLLAAGQSAGGMLVEADLDGLTPDDQRAELIELGGGTSAALPLWQTAGDAARPGDAVRRDQLRPAEVLLAADSNGTVAAVAWSPDPEGILVPELDVRLPRDAAPVMRGVPRVTPCSARPAALPLAVLTRPADGWYASIAVSGRPDLHADELRMDEGSLSHCLEDLASAQRGTLALATSVSRGKVQSLRVPGRR